MRHASPLLTCLLLFGSEGWAGEIARLSNPVAPGAMVIDGQFDDWVSVGAFPPDPGGDAPAGTQDWMEVRVAHDDATLYVLVQRAPGSVAFSSPLGTNGTTGGYGYWIILDTDLKKSTGLRTASGRAFSIGGEFNFGGAMALNRWGPAGDFLGPLDYARVESGSRLELSVPLARLGNPNAFNFVLVTESPGDYCPDGGAQTDYFRYVIRDVPPPPTGEIAVCSNSVAAGAIKVDGALADWAGVVSFPADAAGDVSSGQDYVRSWIAHDDFNFYFRIERTPQSPPLDASPGYWVFFDVDRDSSTGLVFAGNRAFSVGAEYNLAGVREFNTWAAGGCHLGTTHPYSYAVSPDGLTLEVALPRSAMKWAWQFRVIFVGEDSGDYYPEGSDQSAWFRYTTLACNTPCADADGDSDVDQEDFGVFQRCFGPAPPTGPLPETCGCFDQNADLALDLLDFAAFQACVSGPNVPADPGCERPAPPTGDFFNHFVQLPDAPGPFPQPLAPGADPGFPIRGIKGWNWTADQYLNAVPYLAQGKMNFMMNCYLSIFAVQGGNKWWMPLPASAKTAFQQVITACGQNGIEFCFCIHPQLGSSRPLDPTSDSDFEQLWPNYAWAQSAGVRWFCVSLDDIGGVPIVGVQHATLVNKLLARLRLADPEAQVIFCPTYYWGDGSSGHAYLAELGHNLHADAFVFWTGDAVVTPRITKAAADRYKAVVGHRLILWDNYPVNDGGQTLHLGPVIGRDAELGQVLDGYMSNPLYPQDQANRIPMLTCADYAYNPAAYEPCRSVGEVIARLAATPAGRTALKDLVEAYPGMVGFDCGVFATGYNPVRQQYSRLAGHLAVAGAYLGYLRDLSVRLDRECPDMFQDAKATLDLDIQWVAEQYAADGGE